MHMQWNSATPDRRRIYGTYLALSVLLGAGLAAIDLSSTNLNVGILYLLPALLAAKVQRRREFWILIGCFIVLIFLGYLAHRMHSPSLPAYRLVNRLLAALSLLLAAVRLSASIAS